MNGLRKSTALAAFLIAGGLTASSNSEAAGEDTGDAASQVAGRKEALKFLDGIDASVRRDRQGKVISIYLSCTYGLWDSPRPRPKSKWLPHFAEHLHAFPELQQVSVADWVYEDDDLRHFAAIPQLRSFANDTMFGNAPPFTGSGLKHLVMPAKVRRLKLVGKGITDASLAHVSLLSGLRELHIYSDNVTDKGLESLELPDLRTLELHASRVRGNGLASLAGMQNMQLLDLGQNQIEDEGLAHLAGLRQLKELNLRYNRITDAGLKHLANLKELRRLNLSAENVRGPGVRHLAGLTKLETLFFLANPDLNDSAVEPLAGLPALQRVAISKSKVTIGALRRFRERQPKVKLSFHAASAYGLGDKWSLTLDEQWRIRKVSFRQDADDRDLAMFSERPALSGVQYISLPYPQEITGKGLVHLEKLNRLKTLHLDECEIGDEGLKAVGRISQLETLEIDEGGITGEGLAYLAGLKNLKHLELTNMGLVDNDLVHLRGMTKLEFLDLAGNKITEAGAAEHLKGATKLRWLNLSSDSFRGNKILKGDKVQRLLDRR